MMKDNEVPEDTSKIEDNEPAIRRNRSHMMLPKTLKSKAVRKKKKLPA